MKMIVNTTCFLDAIFFIHLIKKETKINREIKKRNVSLCLFCSKPLFNISITMARCCSKEELAIDIVMDYGIT